MSLLNELEVARGLEDFFTGLNLNKWSTSGGIFKLMYVYTEKIFELTKHEEYFVINSPRCA